MPCSLALKRGQGEGTQLHPPGPRARDSPRAPTIQTQRSEGGVGKGSPWGGLPELPSGQSWPVDRVVRPVAVWRAGPGAGGPSPCRPSEELGEFGFGIEVRGKTPIGHSIQKPCVWRKATHPVDSTSQSPCCLFIIVFSRVTLQHTSKYICKYSFLMFSLQKGSIDHLLFCALLYSPSLFRAEPLFSSITVSCSLRWMCCYSGNHLGY